MVSRTTTENLPKQYRWCPCCRGGASGPWHIEVRPAGCDESLRFRWHWRIASWLAPLSPWDRRHLPVRSSTRAHRSPIHKRLAERKRKQIEEAEKERKRKEEEAKKQEILRYYSQKPVKDIITVQKYVRRHLAKKRVRFYSNASLPSQPLIFIGWFN